MQALEAKTQFIDVCVMTGLVDLAGGREAFEAELNLLASQVMRAGLDAKVARVYGRSLSDAACDFDNYPFLARFHAYVGDILLMTLPPELSRWAERFFQMAEHLSLDLLQGALVQQAVHDEDPIRREMWRVLLFEAVRINLMVLYVLNPATAEAGIPLEELSTIAEQTMDEWLAEPPPLGEGMRPFSMLVVSAVSGIERYSAELRSTIGAIEGEYMEEMRWRARLDRELARFDLRDGLLIRNVMTRRPVKKVKKKLYDQPLSYERPLSVEQLQGRHPLPFQGMSRNAIDQRLRRARQRLEARDVTKLQRKGKALVDVMQEASARMEKEGK